MVRNKIKYMNTTRNFHITWKFFCKFVKTICKKILFSAILKKNLIDK